MSLRQIDKNNKLFENNIKKIIKDMDGRTRNKDKRK